MFQIALEGRLDEMMKAEKRAAAKGVTAAVKRAASYMKNDIRRQVKRAGLDKNAQPGRSVSSTWQDKIYPARGSSMESASIVYSKFPKAMQAFEEGAIIRANRAKWLCIPTEFVGKNGNRRLRPQEMGRWKLRFVQSKRSDLAMLVGKQNGKDVVFFWLKKQVKIPKKINFADSAEKWLDALPGYILSEWEKAAARQGVEI